MPIDGTEGCLRAFAQLKQQYSEMKLILSIGGGGKGSENFSAVAQDPAAVETFVQTARDLVDQFGLDGIDSMNHPPPHVLSALLSRIIQG
jgi:chitinase